MGVNRNDKRERARKQNCRDTFFKKTFALEALAFSLVVASMFFQVGLFRGLLSFSRFLWCW